MSKNQYKPRRNGDDYDFDDEDDQVNYRQENRKDQKRDLRRQRANEKRDYGFQTME